MEFEYNLLLMIVLAKGMPLFGGAFTLFTGMLFVGCRYGKK
ncbi:hypothetical protein FLA_4725 [Filimonas lacunae]|nr:hypothetical protein FLA_4725 [Filimonas lacunae]